MATISSPGIGSGLDVNGIISKLMSIEQQPLTKLDTKEASYQSRISALGSLQGAVSSLNTAIASLVPSAGQTAASKYIAYKASVADSGIGSATSVSTSAAGSYSLEVTQLATAHRISTITQAQKLATPATAEKGLAAGKLNLAINGTGSYFQVMNPSDSSLIYTQSGNFDVNINGEVVTPEGYVLQTGFAIPASADSISVSADGIVTAKGTNISPTVLGTLKLATFSGTTPLTEIVSGSGNFSDNGSGVLSLAAPGTSGTDTLKTGYTSTADRVPRGTLSLQVGSTPPVSVVIDSTNDTLDGLKAAINNTTGIGVSADVVADGGGGYRLVLTSATTGVSGKVTLSGLLGFDFDSTSLTGSLTQSTANGGQAAVGGYSSADSVIDQGTLTISLGSGTTKAIVIDSSNATLGGLRDAINNAGLGITAGLTSIGTNDVRLTLTSGTFGESGKISLSGLAGFGFAPNSTTNAFSEATSEGGQAAQGAIIKLNGITIARDSNTITDALQGVTLSVTKKTASDTPTTLTISHDKSSSLTTNLSTIVKAYNDLNKSIRDLGGYNADTKQGGALLGDATLRAVSTSVRNALQAGYAATGSYRRLSDLGLALQKDGSITFDSTKVATATTADFTAVANLATAFGTSGKALTAGMLGSSGTITAASDGAKRSITDLGKRRTELSMRLTQIEARYRKTFSALDALVASMNTTSSYLTRQLANLPGSTTN